MYGVRPARFTIEELVATAREGIKKLPDPEPHPFVWSPEVRRYVVNPEYATFKHGKFQK